MSPLEFAIRIDDQSYTLAEMDRMVTHADAAVGIHISQPVECLVVHRGLETFCRIGQSLVKSEATMLSAIGLRVMPGVSIRRVSFSGGLRTHGAGDAEPMRPSRPMGGRRAPPLCSRHKHQRGPHD
jgi:hypothetical protein